MPIVNYTPVYTCKLVRDGTIATRPTVNSTQKAREVAYEMLKDLPNEQMIVIMLDTKTKVIGSLVVTSGLLDASLVHPREIFRPAFIHNAASVILAHNHPSGDLTPSSADRDVCNRLSKAGDLLGLTVLDFLIVNSDGDSKSFAEDGMMRTD